jgi:3D (Asp-Asp-Asp) domain-containing protein
MGETLVSARRSARAIGRSAESFTITAYATRRQGRVKRSARTKSGVAPAVGRTVAVDPAVIPLGTLLRIEGIGLRIAEDTGRKIKGRRIDLYVDSHEEGRRFGVVKGATVHILSTAQASPELTIAMD